MTSQTIFNGNPVVMDAMIIISFHDLLAFDKLLDWTKGEIVIVKQIKDETPRSKIGIIDWGKYITDGAVKYEEIEGPEQENLFYDYLNSEIEGATIHKGEAGCLALAISKGYGLACDELVVRREFKRKCPSKICINSWGIVRKARRLNLISSDEADELSRGLHAI